MHNVGLDYMYTVFTAIFDFDGQGIVFSPAAYSEPLCSCAPLEVFVPPALSLLLRHRVVSRLTCGNWKSCLKMHLDLKINLIR